MLTRGSGKNGFNDLRPRKNPANVQQKESEPAVVFRDKASEEGEKAKPKEK